MSVVNLDSCQHCIHALISHSPHDIDSHELVPRIQLKEGISAVPKSVGDCGRGQQNNRWQPIPHCLTCPEQVRNTTQYPVTFTHLSSSSPPVITSAQVVPKPIIIQTPQVTHQRDHQTPQYHFPSIPHVHHTPLITTTSSSTPGTFPFSNTLNAASRKPHTNTKPINNPHPRPSYTYKLVTKQKSKKCTRQKRD